MRRIIVECDICGRMISSKIDRPVGTTDMIYFTNSSWSKKRTLIWDGELCDRCKKIVEKEINILVTKLKETLSMRSFISHA